jgi:hypothetical protein
MTTKRTQNILQSLVAYMVFQLVALHAVLASSVVTTHLETGTADSNRFERYFFQQVTRTHHTLKCTSITHIDGKSVHDPPARESKCEATSEVAECQTKSLSPLQATKLAYDSTNFALTTKGFCFDQVAHRRRAPGSRHSRRACALKQGS